MMTLSLMLTYALPALLLCTDTLMLRRHRERRAVAALKDSVKAGLTEPASLHPIIDPSRCLGCGNCTRACPEGDVLGLVDRRAALIDPTSCIGHGACADVCPMGAIKLHPPSLGRRSRGPGPPRTDRADARKCGGSHVHCEGAHKTRRIPIAPQ